VALQVDGRVQQARRLALHAGAVRLDVQRARRLLHEPREPRMVVVHAVARVVAVVHNRRGVHGQNRDRNQPEPAVVHKRHQRHAQVTNANVEILNEAIQLVPRHLGRRPVRAVQAGGVHGELEQNVVCNELVAARRAANVQRLDGLLLGGTYTSVDDE